MSTRVLALRVLGAWSSAQPAATAECPAQLLRFPGFPHPSEHIQVAHVLPWVPQPLGTIASRGPCLGGSSLHTLQDPEPFKDPQALGIPASPRAPPPTPEEPVALTPQAPFNSPERLHAPGDFCDTSPRPLASPMVGCWCQGPLLLWESHLPGGPDSLIYPGSGLLSSGGARTGRSWNSAWRLATVSTSQGARGRRPYILGTWRLPSAHGPYRHFLGWCVFPLPE